MSWRETTSPLRDEAATSRAININADVAEVQAACAKRQLPISAIESLLSGGTRVVMMNGDAAVQMRKALKSKLISGDVRRAAWATQR